MSINVGVGRTFPGFGSPVENASYDQNALAVVGTGVVTLPLPASGNLLGIPGTTAGKIRVKVYGGGGTSPTVVNITVLLSDGTNTVTVAAFQPNVARALSSTGWVDWFCEYLVDTASSGSGGGATGQLLPGGATTATVSITLGGTSPTALCDVQIRPLI